MTNMNTCRRRDCTAWAVIVSLIVGVIAAFLRITATITLSVPALIVAFGIAVAFLGGLLAVSAVSRRIETEGCLCRGINAALVAALLTVLAALVLLAIPFVATSILGAIITGVLAASFALLLTASVCIIRCLTGCDS